MCSVYDGFSGKLGRIRWHTLNLAGQSYRSKSPSLLILYSDSSVAAVITFEVLAVLMPISVASHRQTTKQYLYLIFITGKRYTGSAYEILPLYKHVYKLSRKHSFVYAKSHCGSGTDISHYDFTVTYKEENIRPVACHTLAGQKKKTCSFVSCMATAK